MRVVMWFPLYVYFFKLLLFSIFQNIVRPIVSIYAIKTTTGGIFSNLNYCENAGRYTIHHFLEWIYIFAKISFCKLSFHQLSPFTLFWRLDGNLSRNVHYCGHLQGVTRFACLGNYFIYFYFLSFSEYCSENYLHLHYYND